MPNRFPVIALSAAATLAAGFAPAALQASTSVPYFSVELAGHTEESEAIAGGVLFRCDGNVCTAPRSRDRALRVCSELRREVGIIARFSAGGSPLPAAQLARCNG